MICYWLEGPAILNLHSPLKAVLIFILLLVTFRIGNFVGTWQGECAHGLELLKTNLNLYEYILAIFKYSRRGHWILLQLIVSHHVVAGN